jgi:Na+-transporting NADH:ubiquinone oxidoreductase subunit C
MNDDNPQKALLVVFLVALVCSILVSVASVALKPIQQRNQLVERSRNIVALTGLVEDGVILTSGEILDVVEELDIRIINIETGEFDTEQDAAEFDARAAVNNPELSIMIPPEVDGASLGRRSSYEVIYLVWNDDKLGRIIFPIVGQGMWSTIYGFIALKSDLNTISAVSFYEQTETAGLGDQIKRPDWQGQWQGRKLFDSQGKFRFRTGPGTINPNSAAAAHQVDSLSGATVTSDAVTRMIAYWFGPNGYKTFLDKLISQPPIKAAPTGGTES